MDRKDYRRAIVLAKQAVNLTCCEVAAYDVIAETLGISRADAKQIWQDKTMPKLVGNTGYQIRMMGLDNVVFGKKVELFNY